MAKRRFKIIHGDLRGVPEVRFDPPGPTLAIRESPTQVHLIRAMDVESIEEITEEGNVPLPRKAGWATIRGLMPRPVGFLAGVIFGSRMRLCAVHMKLKDQRKAFLMCDQGALESLSMVLYGDSERRRILRNQNIGFWILVVVFAALCWYFIGHRQSLLPPR
jgi:hypothetical protein